MWNLFPRFHNEALSDPNRFLARTFKIPKFTDKNELKKTSICSELNSPICK